MYTSDGYEKLRVGFRNELAEDMVERRRLTTSGGALFTGRLETEQIEDSVVVIESRGREREREGSPALFARIDSRSGELQVGGAVDETKVEARGVGGPSLGGGGGGIESCLEGTRGGGSEDLLGGTGGGRLWQSPPKVILEGLLNLVVSAPGVLAPTVDVSNSVWPGEAEPSVEGRRIIPGRAVAAEETELMLSAVSGRTESNNFGGLVPFVFNGCGNSAFRALGERGVISVA